MNDIIINNIDNDTDIVNNPFEQYLPTRLFQGLIEDIRDMYFSELCCKLSYEPLDMHNLYPKLQLDRLRSIFLNHRVSPKQVDYIISNLDKDKLIMWLCELTRKYINQN